MTFSVTVREATTAELKRSGGCTHEIILGSPHGKRFFTAKSNDQARVIALWWADFLGVETIDGLPDAQIESKDNNA
jgi:hypothetical protein